MDDKNDLSKWVWNLYPAENAWCQKSSVKQTCSFFNSPVLIFQFAYDKYFKHLSMGIQELGSFKGKYNRIVNKNVY